MLSLGESAFDPYRRPPALEFALLVLQLQLSLQSSSRVKTQSLKKGNWSLKAVFLRTITDIVGTHCSFLKLFVQLLSVRHFKACKSNSKYSYLCYNPMLSTNT